MTDPQATQFESLVADMARSGKTPGSTELEEVAKGLGKLFGVAIDEVAIFGLDEKGKALKFIIPEKLAVVGSIPLTSTHALAVRTWKDRRAEFINNFSVSRHASVFEGVPLGDRQGQLIQKIMSAPILNATNAVGVVQISRKGHSTSDCGPDFAQKDLNRLTSVTPVLERLLTLCKTG